MNCVQNHSKKERKEGRKWWNEVKKGVQDT